MDAKLASYRSTKRRQALLNSFKDRLYNMVSFQQVKVDGEKSTHVIVEADVVPHPKKQDKITPVHKPQHKPRTLSETESILSIASSSSADQHPEDLPASTTPKPPRSYLYYVTYLVYFLFWVTLYAIAIELRFGVVFLMLSALVAIYVNTRTGPKAAGEVSAYSVFNEDFKAIDGTLKAEQFEREIGIRHH
ncbi:hypothetical protein pipiens_001375 [Culex pipiens pipiens]|uniref:SAYSvFN domain-containing protein n=1 Tax=Culex pipiens pipiens TaxID=38569 RepID=A0ABD1CZ75_CULPP